jgi:hypothetical protein
VNATAIDKLLEEQEQDRLEAVKRALERGGMPTEAEIAKVTRALADAFNGLENIAVRLDGITSAKHEELPFTVTFEHVGLIAGFTKVLDIEIDQLRRTADKVDNEIFELDTIRRETSDA